MGGLTATVIVTVVCGCASVKPAPDFRRAGEFVAERTGSPEAYDPSADTLIEEKITGLLAGGVAIDEAVQIALLNNRGFQAAFLDIGASRADVVQSQLLANPTFSLALQFAEGGVGIPKITGGLAQEIADLWQIPIRKQVAEAQLERTILAVAQRGVEIVGDTRIACYRLLAAQQAETITRENLVLVEETLRIAEARRAAGEVGQLDVNLVRANRLDVERELLALERQRQVAQVALAGLLSLTRWTGPWQLRDSLPTPERPDDDEAALILDAMTQRFDAQVAALAVQAAERELKREILRVFPSVILGIEWERPDQQALPGRKLLADTARASIAAGRLAAPTIQSRGERQFEKSLIVDSLLGPSLQVTLPIFDQNQAQIARARFAIEQARKRYEDLLDVIAGQVQEAVTVARNAERLVRFYDQQALPLARDNVEATRRAYQAGEQGIIVVIDAEKALIAQRRAYIDALRDYAVAAAELEQALGGRLPAESPLQPTSAPTEESK